MKKLNIKNLLKKRRNKIEKIKNKDKKTLKFNKKVVLKTIFGVGIFAVCLTVGISLIKSKGDEYVKNINSYSLNLTFNDEENILKGTEKISYTNNSDTTMQNIKFHLYPNAFRENPKNKLVSSANEDKTYYNGFSYGKIEIKSVKIKNENANFSVCGEDNNILSVSLPIEFYPEENVDIEIEFVSFLPQINHRFGVGQNTINFANFYPIVCVYENGSGFKQNPYNSNGDPFYSDVANYDVKIFYSAKYKIASSGNKIETKNQDNLAFSCVKGEKIRDFAFILSDKFEIVSQKVGNTLVEYFSLSGDKNALECLKTACDGLRTFNDLIGIYPYEKLSVVKGSFFTGGMEWPNMVLISDNLQNQQEQNYVIIHEIAHQWWYGLVGNDEYSEAWLDEGLSEYCTTLFFKLNPNYGEDFEMLIDSAIKNYIHFEKVFLSVTGSVDGRMSRTLNEFNTEPEYVMCTYTKGVIMFNSICESVGEKKFSKALKFYFSENKYKNATPADLIYCFSKATGQNLEGFILSFLNGLVVIK